MLTYCLAGARMVPRVCPVRCPERCPMDTLSTITPRKPGVSGRSVTNSVTEGLPSGTKNAPCAHHARGDGGYSRATIVEFDPSDFWGKFRGLPPMPRAQRGVEGDPLRGHPIREGLPSSPV